MKGCASHGAKRIRVHILTDGRDVLDGTSFTFVEQLEKDLEELRKQGIDAFLASGGGRMYVTMDRYEVPCQLQQLNVGIIDCYTHGFFLSFGLQYSLIEVGLW